MKFGVIKVPDTAFHLQFEPVAFNGPDAMFGDTTFIAMRGGTVLGMLYIREEGHRTWRSYGTLVRPAYRRMGVARALWKKFLEVERPRVVRVDLVSDRGKALIESMQLAYPDIRWRITESASRSLRALSNKKGSAA